MSWPACPRCGAKTFVIDSRPSSGEVRRRYRCKDNSSHRWTTIEKIAERIPLAIERKITFDGATRSVKAWARKIGVSTDALLVRLARLPIEEALTVKKGHTPKRLRIADPRREHEPL